MLPKPKKRQVKAACAAALATTLSLTACPLVAEVYKPLFSESMLRQLDPATRERFAQLESENRRRWHNRNPQAPDVAATKRQHEETQAMLQRFEESRRLEAMARAKSSERTAEQQKKCDTVAAEIEELSSGGVFYETTPDGERRYLSDKEVTDRVKSQEKSYKKFCRG